MVESWWAWIDRINCAWPSNPACAGCILPSSSWPHSRLHDAWGFIDVGHALMCHPPAHNTPTGAGHDGAGRQSIPANPCRYALAAPCMAAVPCSLPCTPRSPRIMHQFQRNKKSYGSKSTMYIFYRGTPARRCTFIRQIRPPNHPSPRLPCRAPLNRRCFLDPNPRSPLVAHRFCSNQHICESNSTPTLI